MHWSLCGEETHRISLGCPTQWHFPFDWLITKIQGSNGLKSGASGSMPLSVQMWYSFVIEHWKKTKATTNICMYSPSFHQISFTSFMDKMSTNSDFLDIFFLSNKSNMVLLAWTTKNTQHCHSLPSSLFAPKKEEKTRGFFSKIPGLQESYCSLVVVCKHGTTMLGSKIKNSTKNIQ